MVILSLGVIGMPHFTHGLSHGFPFQIQLVTVVQEAVENRVCQGRIAVSNGMESSSSHSGVSAPLHAANR